MKIYVFGLGYVGIVTAACLCRQGHDVTGVDVSTFKVDSLNMGESPIVEDQIGDFVASGVKSGRLRGSTNPDGVEESDICIVCVGTPSNRNGSLCKTYLEAVMDDIGTRLRKRPNPLLVVIRSTIFPGTMRSITVPRLEAASGNSAGQAFEAVFHPEFMREGSSVRDYFDPPKIVIGERATGTASQLLYLYEGFDTPVFCTSYETAEMIKYCDNMFHAVKITFANEVGQFCRAHGCDSREVMDIFCADRKLNISSKYLRPGFAFGGSCLPKDLRAFLHESKRAEVETPMLSAVLRSNDRLISQTVDLVLSTGCRRVGLVGLAFKPGTDDLRESPFVSLAESLYGKGCQLKIHDHQVEIAKLVGGNQAYVQQHLPHLSRLLVGSISDLDSCELIILGRSVPVEQLERMLSSGKYIVDLVGMGTCPNTDRYISIT